MSPAKEEPWLKGKFEFGGDERDLEYPDTKASWLALDTWAGPKLEIRDEETDAMTEPTVCPKPLSPGTS
jgi:hypothetical protein